MTGAVILAGGRSSRMNYPKSWLKLLDGMTFLELLVDKYRTSCVDKIVVVLNRKYAIGRWSKEVEKIKNKVVLILADNSDKGRGYSLKLGLKELVLFDNVFIQNVDSPFIKVETLYKMKENGLAGGVTQPIYKGKKGHPILVAEPIIKVIINEVEGNQSLREILKDYPKKMIILDDPHVLTNLNTPADFQKIKDEFV